MITSLDIITIAVPPALPLILTVGIGLSMGRLQKRGVFCINPERINFSGRVDVMCFDKTGTLTQGEMELTGIRTVSTNTTTATEDGCQSFLGEMVPGSQFSTVDSNVRRVLATCHGLSTMAIQDDDKNDTAAITITTTTTTELVGSYLEIEMFRATGYTLAHSGPTQNVLARMRAPRGSEWPSHHVLKRFDFAPALQRSSVVVEDVVVCDDGGDGNGGHVVVGGKFACVKGSVEKLVALCGGSGSGGPADGVPATLLRDVERWSKKGFYILGFASKALPAGVQVANLTRADVESNLRFHGVLLFRNELKPDTPAVIQSLKQACIRVKMITGR